MLNYIEGNCKINKYNIHYYRTGGNKPQFVLLHGAADNGLCWARVAGLLAENFDVIMPDFQGHGKSDRLGKEFQSIDHAHQIAGLADALGLKNTFIMGHSMGAAAAANIAVQYPQNSIEDITAQQLQEEE